MKITGIYKIQSKIKPERIYIGSAVNFKDRWRLHKQALRTNKHDNGRLQNHSNKYGIDDLVFSVLLGCERENMIIHEQFFIDALNPFFNICKIAGSRLGVKVSDDTKKKLRKINTGKKVSLETKRKISEANKGRIVSEETKEKMRNKHISSDTRKKISEALKGNKNGCGCKGRIVSEEIRRKMSETRKGRTPWNKGKKDIYSEETLSKMRNVKKGKHPWNYGLTGVQSGENHPMYGRHHTDESKEKNRIAHKKIQPCLLP